MFKRKQRQPTPTTPPNFLDLRNIAQLPAAAPKRSRFFSDVITAPVSVGRRVSGRPRPALICAAVVVVGCIGMTAFMATAHHPKNPMSAAVVSKFAGTAYYPTYLPKNYLLQADTATVTSGSLTFTASNGSASIFFSEQPLPKGMDLQAFYDTQMPDRATVHTAYGDAAIGHFANMSQLAREHTNDPTAAANQATIASLATTNSWVLITAPSNFSAGQMQQIVDGLRR